MMGVKSFVWSVRQLLRIVVLLMCSWALSVVAEPVATKGESLLPIAHAGHDLSSLVGAPVIVDGSQSHDPGGQRIIFHWAIRQAPPGSTATLAASDPAPVFVPDLPGIYRLQLVVSNQDEVASLPANMSLVVFEANAAPNARAGKDRSVRVGTPVDFDARASYDPRQVPLDFLWTLVSVPAASRITNADIRLRDSATPWFVPDVPGAYGLELAATNGEFTATDRVTATAVLGNLPPIADAGNHQYVARTGPFALNGEGSFDPDRGPLSLAFAWSLVARPQTSVLTSSAIRDARAATTSFMPDVAGVYTFRLTVSDGEASDAENVLLRYATEPAADPVDSPGESANRRIAAGIPTARAFAVADGDARRRPPVLELALSPAELTVAPGNAGAYTVKLQARGSIAAVAKLDVTGLPRGVGAIFAMPILALGASTTLTLRANRDVSVGSYPLLVTASGRLNDVFVKRFASVTLRVVAAEAGAAERSICGTANLAGLASKRYVSPGGSQRKDCGSTVATACGSIQQGIDNCGAAGCGVLVRHGRYATTSTIVLRDGVSVFGSCNFGSASGAEPAAANYRTVIEASPPAGAPAIHGESINVPTVVHGLVVVGKDESAAGQASIVMTASQSKGITLQNSALIAGRGGDGGTGQTPQGAVGGAGAAPRSYLGQGGVGGAACESHPTGGPGNGGQGANPQFFQGDCGDLYCDCNTDSADFSFGRDGAPSGRVSGGTGGERGGVGCGCLYAYQSSVPIGSSGKPGASGACGSEVGAPGDLFGTFQGARWNPGRGGAGGAGDVGSGGGGGGSGYKTAYPYAIYSTLFPGLPGGGGGGGGCGGPGGIGGEQGGAAIALVLVDSVVSGVPELNVIVPGPGGRGGTGGPGGIGGMGGPGGAGNQGEFERLEWSRCSALVPGTAGPGGQGGQGGAGGGGAGGNGGPSIGIALVAGSPTPGSGSGIYNAVPGSGGSQGGGGKNVPTPTDPNPCQGPSGKDGVRGGGALIFDAKARALANPRVPGGQPR